MPPAGIKWAFVEGGGYTSPKICYTSPKYNYTSPKRSYTLPKNDHSIKIKGIWVKGYAAETIFYTIVGCAGRNHHTLFLNSAPCKNTGMKKKINGYYF